MVVPHLREDLGVEFLPPSPVLFRPGLFLLRPTVDLLSGGGKGSFVWCVPKIRVTLKFYFPSLSSTPTPSPHSWILVGVPYFGCLWVLRYC